MKCIQDKKDIVKDDVIESCLKEITRCINVSSKKLPKKSFNKHVKTYWNDRLSAAAKHKKQMLEKNG